MTRKKNSKKPDKINEPLVDLSEEDQWRIIQDSGILKQLPTHPESTEAVAEAEPLLSPLTEEIFAALSLIIPHSFLLLLFEILAHYQYGRKPTREALFDRMVSGVPILCVFIFYTNRYKYLREVQLLLFVLGTLCGSRLVWVLNHSNWKNVMKLCPPLATAWVYTIVQLHLGHAIMSLGAVYWFVWYKNLSISPY